MCLTISFSEDSLIICIGERGKQIKKTYKQIGFCSTFILGRDPDGGYSPFHGAERPARPRIDRDPLCLLHGGERCHLPALCLIPDDRQPLADHLLPCLLHRHRCDFRPHLVPVPSWQAQDHHPLRVRSRGNLYTPAVSLHGAPSPEARVLGGPLDAPHPLRIHIPRRLPSRGPQGAILRQVRHLFGRYGGRLSPLWCTC